MFIYSGLWFVYRSLAASSCFLIYLQLSLWSPRSHLTAHSVTYSHSCHGNKLCFVFVASIRLSVARILAHSATHLLQFHQCVTIQIVCDGVSFPAFFCFAGNTIFIIFKEANAFIRGLSRRCFYTQRRIVENKLIPRSADRRLLLCSSVFLRTCADACPQSWTSAVTVNAQPWPLPDPKPASILTDINYKSSASKEES